MVMGRASSQEVPVTGTKGTYTVAGMTCEHCTRAVAEEIMKILSVERAEVDLASGEARVSGEGFDDDAVAGAVAEAGYEVRS